MGYLKVVMTGHDYCTRQERLKVSCNKVKPQDSPMQQTINYHLHWVFTN